MMKVKELKELLEKFDENLMIGITGGMYDMGEGAELIIFRENMYEDNAKVIMEY